MPITHRRWLAAAASHAVNTCTVGAWSQLNVTHAAFAGSIAIAGAGISWLRDKLQVGCE